MATSAFRFLGRTVVSLGASGATDLGCVSSLQQQQQNHKQKGVILRRRLR